MLDICEISKLIDKKISHIFWHWFENTTLEISPKSTHIFLLSVLPFGNIVWQKTSESPEDIVFSETKRFKILQRSIAITLKRKLYFILGSRTTIAKKKKI